MNDREMCETVTVKGDDGNPLRINRADYDAEPGRYVLIDGDAEVPGPSSDDEPVELDVAKIGKAFFVVNKATVLPVTVNANGVTVNNDGAGYKIDTDAWSAAYMAAS